MNTEKTWIEYHMEHKVGQTEASIAFNQYRNKLLNEKSPTWCKDTPCTDEIRKYCSSQHMLNDHCCCDARHNQEQLPWLPHSCYVAEECRPFTGSCFKYTEWRECCCDRILAKKWSSLFSSSTKLLVNSLMLFLCASYYCYYYFF